MTSTSGAVNPEIQALLEEIARDPRSHLLRVPRLHLPLAFEPPVRPGEAFLTKAERHLLKSHRDEVAQLLLDAARRAAYAHPRAATRLHRCLTVDRELDLGDPEEWRRRSLYEMELAPDDCRQSEEFEVLKECTRTKRAPHCSSATMALASLRLVPRAEARICLAAGLGLDGHVRSGTIVLSKTIVLGSSILNEQCALELLGSFLFEVGSVHQAHAAYRRGSFGETRSTPVMNWMLVALQLGDSRSALEAANCLGDRIDDEDGSINAFLRIHQDRPRSMIKKATELLLRLESSFPPPARRVAASVFS